MSEIKKNFFYNLIFILSTILFPIVTFPYAARILGPLGIGKVQFISTFSQYFVLIALLGVPIYGIREVAKRKDDKHALKKLFTELVFLNFCWSLILLFLYILIVSLIPSMRVDWNFYAVAALSLIFSFSTIDWFFSGLEKFRFIALRSIIVKLLATIFLFIIVKTKADAIYYLGILTGAVVLTNCWNIVSAWQFFDVKMLSKKGVATHFAPLFYIFSTSAAISVYAVSDVLVLGFLKSYSDVGYYTAATKINKVSIPILTALGTVLIPRISTAFRIENWTEIRALVQSSLEFVTLFGIPMSIGLIALAPELILIFSGKEFTPSILTMQLFAPIVFIIGLSNVWGIQILTPGGKDKQVTFSVLLGLIVSLSLNFILIPRYSYFGAAISNLLSELVVMLTFFYFAKKLIPITINIKTCLQSLVVSLLFFPLSFFIRGFFGGQNIIICLFVILGGILTFICFQVFIFRNQFMIQQIRLIRNRFSIGYL